MVFKQLNKKKIFSFQLIYFYDFSSKNIGIFDVPKTQCSISDRLNLRIKTLGNL